MADMDDDTLAHFFDAAKTDDNPDVPESLMARVLADAAEIGAEFADPKQASVDSQNWLSRLFAPIGGLGGAFALGAFASVGFVVGLGDTEMLYSLPVMGDILATFSDNLGNGTPLDTLDYLMAES